MSPLLLCFYKRQYFQDCLFVYLAFSFLPVKWVKKIFDFSLSVVNLHLVQKTTSFCSFRSSVCFNSYFVVIFPNRLCEPAFYFTENALFAHHSASLPAVFLSLWLHIQMGNSPTEFSHASVHPPLPSPFPCASSLPPCPNRTDQWLQTHFKIAHFYSLVQFHYFCFIFKRFWW